MALRDLPVVRVAAEAPGQFGELDVVGAGAGDLPEGPPAQPVPVGGGAEQLGGDEVDQCGDERVRPGRGARSRAGGGLLHPLGHPGAPGRAGGNGLAEQALQASDGRLRLAGADGLPGGHRQQALGESGEGEGPAEVPGPAAQFLAQVEQQVGGVRGVAAGRVLVVGGRCEVGPAEVGTAQVRRGPAQVCRVPGVQAREEGGAPAEPPARAFDHRRGAVRDGQSPRPDGRCLAGHFQADE